MKPYAVALERGLEPPPGNVAWLVYDPEEPRPLPATLSELDRESLKALCACSLGDFVIQAWPAVPELQGTPFSWGWHLDVLCDHVQAVLEPQLRGRRVIEGLMPRTGLPRPRDPVRDLIINVPPGTMKSLVLNVFAPAWMWTRNPSWSVTCASGNEKAALRDSTRCRDLLRSEWYQQLFRPKWSFSADNDGKEKFQNTAGGVRMVRTVGQAVTGDRADAIFVDDPNDAQQIRSDAYRKRINEDWWGAAMSNRVNNPKTAVRVIIMQRLHEEDLTGYILEKDKLRSEGGTWEQLLIPMEHEQPPAGAEVPKSFLGWVDPRKLEGELLMPHRFPPEFVQAEKVTKGSAGYAGQYQQRPAPKEGNRFKRDWWRFWRYDGEPLVQPNRPQGCSGVAAVLLPAPYLWEDSCESWDFTFKGKDSNDWVVGVKVVRVGAQRFILDVWRKHTGFGGGKAGLVELRSRVPRIDGPVLVEDKANGPAIMEELSKILSGLVDFNPKDGKEQRAAVMEPQVEAGNWFLRDGAHWLDTFVTEFAVFPNGKHDDQVDATSQAEARFGKDSELEEARILYGIR
jgi:phage terminase large subunit-like protein